MRALKIAVGLAVGLAVLAPISAYLLDRAYGQDVQPVAQSSPEAVRANKALWMQGDPVAEVYGVPGERTLRVVFVDPDRVLVPKEDRSLRLLLIDKQHGENPLQAKTLYFVAWRISVGLAIAAALGFGLLLLISRRRRGANVAQAASHGSTS